MPGMESGVGGWGDVWVLLMHAWHGLWGGSVGGWEDVWMLAVHAMHGEKCVLAFLWKWALSCLNYKRTWIPDWPVIGACPSK